MGKETGVAIYELYRKNKDKYQIRDFLKLKRQDVDYWLKKRKWMDSTKNKRTSNKKKKITS